MGIHGEGYIPEFEVSYQYSQFSKFESRLKLYNVPLEWWPKKGPVTELYGSVTLSVWLTNNNTIGVRHLAASTTECFLKGVSPNPDAQPSNDLSLHRILEAQQFHQPDGQCSGASSARSSVSEASTVASQSDLLPEEKLPLKTAEAESNALLDETPATWELRDSLLDEEEDYVVAVEVISR